MHKVTHSHCTAEGQWIKLDIFYHRRMVHTTSTIE